MTQPEPVRATAQRSHFRDPGVRLRLADLSIGIRIDVQAVVGPTMDMYVGHTLELGAGIDDFRIDITYTGLIRRLIKRQTQASIDGAIAFLPLPLRLTYLSIEAALNWCVSSTPSYVVLHAAVVERNGLAVILPAPSASGKSTLCAALVTRGWRLLSDELGVIRPADGQLQPLARPISLKNESIDLIREWAPDSHFSPRYTGTRRGDIAFLRPPAESVARRSETVMPALIVSPAYRANAPVTLQPLGKSETFRLLVDNSLNYRSTQSVGFATVARLVDTCPAYRLSFGTLAQAMEAMDNLLVQTRTGRASNRLLAPAI